jgi:hypothetical protein
MIKLGTISTLPETHCNNYGAQYKTDIPYKAKLGGLKNDEAGLHFIW